VGLLGIQDRERFAVLRYVEHAMPQEISTTPCMVSGEGACGASYKYQQTFVK